MAGRWRECLRCSTRDYRWPDRGFSQSQRPPLGRRDRVPRRRAFKPVVTNRGKRGTETAFWWLDYTIHGKRYREPSGTTDYTTALAILAEQREDRRAGRPVAAEERPVSVALWPYVLEYIGRKAGKISARWLDNTFRHPSERLTLKAGQGMFAVRAANMQGRKIA